MWYIVVAIVCSFGGYILGALMASGARQDDVMEKMINNKFPGVPQNNSEPVEIENPLPDLTDLPEEEKRNMIDSFIRLTSVPMMQVFMAMGLKTHIEAMVTNQATGEEYIISFKKLANGKLPDINQK